MMDLFHCLSITSVLIFFFHSTYCMPGCETVSCPERLDCRYPKVSVVLPDPYNKDCCNITECICEGTDSRLSSSHDPDMQYEAILRYTNCTMIDGNLEIVYIHPKENFKTLDATKHIRSVTGYVLIASTYVQYIDLSSLRLIRGTMLYDDTQTNDEACGQTTIDKSKGYALYISGNYLENVPSMGLKEIHMPLLTEIMRGNVKVYENRDLCFIDSIIWDDEIVNSPEQEVLININRTEPKLCPSCPASCVHKVVDSDRHCWGQSDELCQQFTRRPCRHNCLRRCNLDGVCCESYCAAGCATTGECHACKYYNNFGKCEQRCPAGSTSSSTDIVSAVDKDLIQYELFWYCVPECPSTRRIFEPERKCVLTCPLNYYAENGRCKECPSGGCPNICYGLKAKLGPLKNDEAIHSGNIGNFSKNCTIIEGSLNFRETTFFGDTHCKIPAITEKSVFDVFENVEEITGYLSIEHWPYPDLCIFKNLKRIRGYEKRLDAYSVLIMTDGRDLKQLCLNSLEEIQSGRIIVYNNRGLCQVDTLNWIHLFKQPNTQSTLVANNAKKRKCRPCDDNCDSKNGCWGPDSTQCVTCNSFTDYTNSFGQFTDSWVTDHATGKPVPGHNTTNCVKICDFSKGVYTTLDKKCFPCDLQCNLTCAGPGPSNCTAFSSLSMHGCKNVYLGGICIAKCPVTHYADQYNICKECSIGCVDGGCNGSDEAYSKNGCSSCYKKFDSDAELMIYRGPKCQVCLDNLKDLECAHGCTHNNITNVYECFTRPSSTYIIWIVVTCVIIVLAASILIILFKCRKTIRTMRKHIGDKIIGDASQPDEFDSPLTPSGTAPNRAHLRIVKENELSLGKELGSGAFGAVYKAVWTSMHIEGQTIKIPVAVKQLKTFSHTNEIMDEAYVMASVDSPYLIRLLGICMTEQVSLITQLMPLGSLLEYVRGNTDNIGSRHMLTWCMQIAKGMQYLEDKHLVHRDLAARNVLVKTPHHVKITDFGLSKMLNASQSVYFAEGGKLPIKWLAMECITERKFSHQSDVWAFGVTCWEIITFGARPYDGVRAVDVLSLLERGDRLTQPSICTIEVYMLLLKCWQVDSLSRPRFYELVEEFTKLCHDHTRYLVIKNDMNRNLMSPNPEEEKRFFERLIKEDNGDVDGELMVDEPDTYLLFHGEPEYQNQTAVDQQQGVPTVNGVASNSSGMHSSGNRLFSRNTPSAQLPSPTANIHTSTYPPMSEIACALPRVSDSSNPDDVFSTSWHGLCDSTIPLKSMTVDLPSEKRTEARPVRYRPSQTGGHWNMQGRKDSEENSRYTEDPTTHNRSSYIDPESTPSTVDHEVLSSPGHLDGMVYDEDEYLLPTPGQHNGPSDYFDPSKPYSEQKTNEPTMKADRGRDDTLGSLTNSTYVESEKIVPIHNTQSVSLTTKKSSDDGPEYVNSQMEDNYSNWDSNKNDTMMSNVLPSNDPAKRPLLANRSSGSPDGRVSEQATYFNNEEYMTTDSGIGDDNHLVLSSAAGLDHLNGTGIKYPSRNRQNSSLSSAGSISNGSGGTTIGGSPLHRAYLSSDEQQVDLEHGSVRYKPVPKPRQSVNKRPQKNVSSSTSVGLDNPEYMMLQESVSDSKALLHGDSTDA